MEVCGEEDKSLHLVRDGVVSRSNVDITAAEKKHTSAVEGFEKESKPAKEAKLAWEAGLLSFNMVKVTHHAAKAAFETATLAYTKEAGEEKAAKLLAEDESWKKGVQDLQSSTIQAGIQALSTFRLEVEDLTSQYIR